MKISKGSIYKRERRYRRNIEGPGTKNNV